MNKLLVLSLMLLCTAAEAKQWFADHHRRQSMDDFIAGVTHHAQTRTAQRAA